MPRQLGWNPFAGPGTGRSPLSLHRKYDSLSYGVATATHRNPNHADSESTILEQVWTGTSFQCSSWRTSRRVMLAYLQSRLSSGKLASEAFPNPVSQAPRPRQPTAAGASFPDGRDARFAATFLFLIRASSLHHAPPCSISPQPCLQCLPRPTQYAACVTKSGLDPPSSGQRASSRAADRRSRPGLAALAPASHSKPTPGARLLQCCC